MFFSQLGLGSVLEFSQFHGQSHVALNLQLPLEECLKKHKSKRFGVTLFYTLKSTCVIFRLKGQF